MAKTLVLLLAASTTLSSSAAYAQNRCDLLKLKATGKEAACLLRIEATQAAGGSAGGTQVANCRGKFANAFTKGDSIGSCHTSGDRNRIEAKVDAFVGTIDTALGGNPPVNASRCTSAKTRAAARKTACILKLRARAANKAVAPVPLAVARCEARFVSVFTIADARGDCLGPTGDAAAIESIIDAFVNNADHALNSSCYDQTTDGQETSADCGGPACRRCSIGSRCLSGSDCSSGYCADGLCQSPPTCGNTVQDGQETDVDCGGPFCPACRAGSSCDDAFSCQSGVCSGNVCTPPTCSDGESNDGETGMDCGGGSCGACGPGGGCNTNSDCSGGVCGYYGICDETDPLPPPAPCNCDTCKTLRMNAGNLPKPTLCTATNATNADACNGWMPAGTLDNPDDIVVDGFNRASLFVKDFPTACGNFTCAYLPRWDNVTEPEQDPSSGMAHGLLCFNETTCSACAYDLRADDDDPAAARPFTELKTRDEDDEFQNCSRCHGPGPILPKYKLWRAAKRSLQPRNYDCAGTGGPNWLCATNADGWSAPNDDDRVRLDGVSTDFSNSCGGGGCHGQGFIVNRADERTYCEVLWKAFEVGGSMRGRGVHFASFDDCYDWLALMGCPGNGYCERIATTTTITTTTTTTTSSTTTTT